MKCIRDCNDSLKIYFAILNCSFEVQKKLFECQTGTLFLL